MHQIIGALASLIVLALTVRFLLKNYPPQIVLFVAGLVLMFISVPLGATAPAILGKVKTTGLIGFDIYKFIEWTMGARVVDLGLVIMAAGGFAAYMDKIGASRALVLAMTKPLAALKAPYLVLAMAAVIGAPLKMFIPSAAGLSMLLMVTLYPIVVALGVSRIAAAAVVVTCGCFDIGPANPNSNLAAQYAGLDIAVYYVKHQLPVAVIGYLGLGVFHYFSAQYLDKKERVGTIFGGEEGSAASGSVSDENGDAAMPPRFYLLFPLLPLVLLLVFSPYGIKGIKMSVVSAMLICLSIAVCCEALRHRNVKAAFTDSVRFFDAMGGMFSSVVVLTVAGETFAKGLTLTGAVDMFISAAKNFGFGSTGMTIVMTVFIIISTIVLGGGNASFFAFASLAPTIAKDLGFPVIYMMLPMQIAAGAGRVLSPIAAVVIAVGGVAGISPFDLIRRTFIPGLGATTLTIIAALLFG